MYDIIIIGAGPAGISAGIYAVSRGKRTLVLEKAQVGGIIGKVSTVTHYTAIQQQETGTTFAARMKEQALQAGVEIVNATVTGVTLTGELKRITTDNGTYEAKRVILANGGTPRKLGIPGEQELAGKGMGMNAARDGAAYTGKNIYVVGCADGAVKEALYLAQFARHLTIIHFEEHLGCIAEFRQKVGEAENISLCLDSRLHAVYGQDEVESLEILNERDGPRLRHLCLCRRHAQHGTLYGTETAGRLHPDQREDGNRHSRRLCGRRHPGQAGAPGGHGRIRRCDCSH